jgi:hypothetical protein
MDDIGVGAWGMAMANREHRTKKRSECFFSFSLLHFR